MSLVWSGNVGQPAEPSRALVCTGGKCSTSLVRREPQAPTRAAQAPSSASLVSSRAPAGEGGALVKAGSHAHNAAVGIATERLAFKRWLLYVLPDNRPCIAAMQLAVQVEADVHITNLATVPRAKRPTWLTGVPTLVDLVNQLKYEGTPALEQLQRYVAAEPLPVSSMTKQYYRLGVEGDTEKEWGAPAGQHDYIMPELGTDPRYETQAPIQAAHVDALRNARQAQLDDLKAGMDNKPDPDRALPAPTNPQLKALPPPPRAR